MPAGSRALCGRHTTRRGLVAARFRTAFDALTAWVEEGGEPPAGGTVERPEGIGALDPALLHTCSLDSGG